MKYYISDYLKDKNHSEALQAMFDAAHESNTRRATFDLEDKEITYN